MLQETLKQYLACFKFKVVGSFPHKACLLVMSLKFIFVWFEIQFPLFHNAQLNFKLTVHFLESFFLDRSEN